MNSSSQLAQVLRAQTKKKAKGIKGKVKEAAAILREAPAETSEASPESGIFQVILISEGLGNRRQMNYYGPESIQSAPAIFEGKPCFIDHPSETEERDRPERSTWHKVGYYKNCRVVEQEGKLALAAELHLDNSESGQFATAKARAALHYKAEFPESGEEYIGLSVHADGDTERKLVEVDGERVEVNYVERFTAAQSCDIVTMPARGGKFLALVESAAGAILPTQEETKMLIESLKAALAALKESVASKDPKAATAKLAEGTKVVETLLAEATKLVAKVKESETKKEDEAETETETEAESAEAKKAKAAGMYEKGAAMMAQALAMGHTVPGAAPAEPAEKPAVIPGKSDEKPAEKCQAEGELIHLPSETEAKPKEGEGETEDEAVESKRLAIEHLLREAAIAKEFVNLDSLLKGSLKEAKSEINRTKKMVESIAKGIVAKMGLPAGHPVKAVEGANGAASNQGLFSETLKK